MAKPSAVKGSSNPSLFQVTTARTSHASSRTTIAPNPQVTRPVSWLSPAATGPAKHHKLHNHQHSNYNQDHHIPCYVYYIAMLLFLIFGLIGFKIYNWFFSPPSQSADPHPRPLPFSLN
ncbi:hypothetical protein QL285_029052 [Trifolium repens]|nr:hypothetical protein QL285_029052 [Trifolium repens]